MCKIVLVVTDGLAISSGHRWLCLALGLGSYEPDGHYNQYALFVFVSVSILGNCSQRDASSLSYDHCGAFDSHRWYTPLCAGCGLDWTQSSVVAPEVSHFVIFEVIVVGQGDRSYEQTQCSSRLQALGDIFSIFKRRPCYAVFMIEKPMMIWQI